MESPQNDNTTTRTIGQGWITKLPTSEACKVAHAWGYNKAAEYALGEQAGQAHPDLPNAPIALAYEFRELQASLQVQGFAIPANVREEALDTLCKGANDAEQDLARERGQHEYPRI